MRIFVCVLISASLSWASATATISQDPAIPCGSTSASSANVVLNPGFEEMAGGLPVGWTTHAPRPEISPGFASDSEVALSGGRSLRLSGDGKTGGVGWVTGRCLRIQAGSAYELVAHFRVAGIPSIQESVWVNLTWRRDTSDPRPRVAYLDTVTRVGDWWRVSGRLRAPEGATIADVSLGLRQAPRGQLWWDDISLREVPAAPSRRVRLATTFLPPAQRNAAGWRRAIQQAGEGKADVVCLGELPEIVAPDPAARPTIPGPATVTLAELARQYHMLIIVSLPEWKGDLLYNTAVIIGRDGIILGTYRKTHLPEVEVERGTTPGSELSVFDTDIGRIGLQICYDHFFPEVARVLALRGAEVIFTPIAGDERAAYKAVASARAVDNSVFYVTSSRNDPSSLIVDPSGRVVAESTGNPEVVFADVDLDAPYYEFELSVEGEAEFRYLWPKERRPSLYHSLTEEL